MGRVAWLGSGVNGGCTCGGLGLFLGSRYLLWYDMTVSSLDVHMLFHTKERKLCTPLQTHN